MRSLNRREPSFNWSLFHQILPVLIFVFIIFLSLVFLGCMSESYLPSVQGGV